MSTTSATQPEAPHAASRAWKLAALATLAAAALAAGGYLLLRSRPSQPVSALRYETAPTTRGPLQAQITASGTLSPLITVQVGSQVSGRVKSLGADFNSRVKKGQVIARLDPELYQALVEQARANRLAAQGNTERAAAQLEDAQRQAVRSRELVAQHLIAQQDADTGETALKVARATLSAARGSEAQTAAALHQAEVNLAYATVVSPIDGVVISRNVDVGQTVAASLASPTLFVIAQDLKLMQVDTSVAEADVGRLKAGMASRFTVDAYPGESFEGVIREVRNAPQTVQNVVTYDAVIDVQNPELKLKPGMTANVTVIYADRPQALKVSNAALRFRPPAELTAGRPPEAAHSDRRTLWVLQGTTASPVQVRVGVSDGSSTEVLEGPLEAGAAVITEAVGASKSGPGSFGRVF